MENRIINTKKIIRIIIGIITILLIAPSNLSAQETQIVISAKRVIGDQEEVIRYQSIKESEIVDFSNLLRVYINKASVVMVDNSPVPFDETGESIKKILITDIESSYGMVTPENIAKSKCNLVLLVRKSVFTKDSDFTSLLEMMNTTIFGLMQHYSQQVYEKDFDILSPQQKVNIRKLVPLSNYLADDVKI